MRNAYREFSLEEKDIFWDSREKTRTVHESWGSLRRGEVIMRLRTELLLNTIPVSRTPLGAFAKLREATVSFVTSVRLHGTNLSHGIFMKFDISGLLENVEKIQVLLQSDINKAHNLRRLVYICDNISLNSPYNEKLFSQKL